MFLFVIVIVVVAVVAVVVVVAAASAAAAALGPCFRLTERCLLNMRNDPRSLFAGLSSLD